MGKAVLRGKSIAIQAYLKKTRKSSDKQSNFTGRETSKRTTYKAQSKWKGGKNKDQSKNK